MQPLLCREAAFLCIMITPSVCLRQPPPSKREADKRSAESLKLTEKLEKKAVKLIQIFQEKLSICARRFPKGDRKALWWGDRAKPHILKIPRLLYLEMTGLCLTAPNTLWISYVKSSSFFAVSRLRGLRIGSKTHMAEYSQFWQALSVPRSYGESSISPP